MNSYFDKPANLDDVLETLQTGDPERSVKTLWHVAEYDCVPTWLGPNADVVAGSLVREAKRFRRLLSENTGIRRDRFTDLVGQLSVILTHTRDHVHERLGRSSQLSHTCSAYRLERSNFTPLSDMTRAVTGDWGRLLYCRADADHFFALASGKTTPVLVHFDEATRKPQDLESIRDRYARAIRRFLDEGYSNVVLVNKEFGPGGPARIWSQMAERLGNPGVLCLDETKGTMSGVAAARPGGAVVLYDLIHSGHGLSQISKRVLAEGGVDRVAAVILYQYSAKLPATVGSYRRIETLFNVNDDEQLDPARLAVGDRADGVRVSATSPFSRIQPEDVDPVRGRRQSRSDDVESVLRSEREMKKYEGQWIAILDGRISAAGTTLPELQQKLRQQSFASLPLVHYVRSVA